MAKMVLPLVPIFFLKATGKVSCDVDPEMVKDFTGIDVTKIAFQNMYQIISEKCKKRTTSLLSTI